MEPPILETRPCLYFIEKKDLSFDDLAGPVKKMAFPQHGPQNKFTKLYNYGHETIKTVYTSRLWQHQSSHRFDQLSNI